MGRAVKGRIAALVVLFAVTGLVAWWQWSGFRPSRHPISLNGVTQGTTYSITVHGPAAVTREALQEAIDKRLREIVASMSTWEADSEISRINRLPAGEPVEVSPDFATVLTAALDWARRTEGAFDPTVGPLVNAWGFGPEKRATPPSPEEIAATMERIGYGNLTFQGRTLIKRREGMYLDFSGIAQGYTVDEVGRVIESLGFSDYIVEIGGEVMAKGRSPRGEPWTVGIERPEENEAPGEALVSVVNLPGGALSTSGSYRHFVREGGEKRHHIIDPRTGMPTHSSLVSVTVDAPDCTSADAIATALMVMGVEKGMQWVKDHPGVEALFLEARPEGGFAQHLTPGFGRLVR